MGYLHIICFHTYYIFYILYGATLDNSEVEGPKPQTRVPDHPMLTNTTTRPFGYDWQNA